MESITHVSTDRAARYGKQLCAHMGRKIDASWEGEHGRLDFHGAAQALLSAHPHELTISLTVPADASSATPPSAISETEENPLTPPEVLARFERIVGIHLARFGAKDGLVVAWKHPDGTAGSTQGPLSADGE